MELKYKECSPSATGIIILNRNLLAPIVVNFVNTIIAIMSAAIATQRKKVPRIDTATVSCEHVQQDPLG